MEILFKNLGVFIIPAMILIAISTMLIVRAYHLREAKLAALIIGIYGCMFIIEWVRMELPIEYSFWIHHLLTGTLTVLTLGIITHSSYLLIEQHRTITIRYSPYVFYIPTVFQIIYVPVIYKLFGTEYIEINHWYYVQHPLFTYVANPFMFIYMLMMLYILNNGIKTAPTLERKKLYRLFVVNLYVMLAAGLVLSIVFREQAIVPDPILFVIFYTAMNYAAGMLLHQFSPSLAQRYRTVMDLSPTGIIVVNAKGIVTEVNKTTENLLPIKVNMNITHLFTEKTIGFLNQVIEQFKSEEYLSNLPIQYVHPHTKIQYDLLINATKLLVDNQLHYTITLRDVTLERQQERINYQLAYFDTLTNLYNRTYFQENVVKEFNNYPHSALILCDLNYFKHINDTYGHDIGDQVLQFTANQFLKRANDKVIVARLGGDEFIFFVKDARTFEVAVFVDFLHLHFEFEPFMHDGKPMRIVPSFGYATRYFGTETYEELFRSADEAMYKNKIEIKLQHKGQV